MPKRAVCNFCSQFDHKQQWCYSKKCNILHHPLKPINCYRYDGIPLTQEQLDRYEGMAREAERRS